MKTFFASKYFAWGVVALVGGVVVYGVVLSGTPGQQRLEQFDQRRVGGLQQIAWSIDEYWTRNQALPESLEELQNFRYASLNSIADPETREPYEYRILGERMYELCAIFATDSTNEGDRLYKPFSRVWEHGVGRTCFDLEAEPREYSQ